MAHPSHVQTNKDFDDVMAGTIRLSNEELVEALKILNAELLGQKPTQGIRDEIERLAEESLTLETTFGNVKASLTSISNHAEDLNMKKDIDQMSQVWRKHSDVSFSPGPPSIWFAHTAVFSPPFFIL